MQRQSTLVFWGLLTWFFQFPSSLTAAEVCPQIAGEPALFKVGQAQLSITPLAKITLAGYGTYFLNRSATRMNDAGIHDPIYSSALWLQADRDQAVAIVALDLVGISRATLARVESAVKQKLDIPAVTVILSASHTHHAPDVLGLWGALPFYTGRDAQYMDFLERSITQSILASADEARCSSINWAQGSKATSWHETLPQGSEQEETITALEFIDAATGLARGTLTQWSAHPTVLEANNNALSSDFPGAFRHFLGTQRPGLHFYVNGMLGASYIPLKDSDVRADPFVGGDHDPDVGLGYEQVSYHGFDLAAKVDQMLSLNSAALQQAKIEIVQHRFRLPVSNGLFKLADQLRIIESRELYHGYVTTEIDLIRIGELQIATLPGEMFPSGSGRIRQLLQNTHNGPVMFLGVANDWLGYLMSPEEYNDSRFSYNKSLAPDSQAMNNIVREYQKILQGK